MKRLLFLFILFTSATLFAKEPELNVYLAVKHLAEGETGKLHLVSYDQDVSILNKEIQGNGFELSLWRARTLITQNNRRAFVYIYQLTPSRTGSFVTPIIEVESNGKRYSTNTVTFKVHPLEVFTEKEVIVAGRKHRYRSALFSEKDETYVNETVSAELRFLLPKSLEISQWGACSANTSLQLAAWRFDPPDVHARIGYSNSSTTLMIGKQRYLGVAYHSTLHGLKAGKATLGPLSASCAFSISQMGVFGPQVDYVRRPLEADQLALSIRPLPENAPQGFNGNVGNFSLDTILPESNQVSLDESLKFSLLINGKGNFQTIAAPLLKDSGNWEVIDTTRIEPDHLRKTSQSSVEFQYLVRPKKAVTRSPQFVMNYFNPDAKQFEILFSKTKELQFSASKVTGVPANSRAQEDQQNILGFIDFTPYSSKLAYNLPFSWHWVPVSIAGIIFGLWLKRQRRQYLLTHTKELIKDRDLKALKQPNLNNIQFYKAVGSYVEQWVSTEKRTSAQTLLEERDALCFTPNPKEQSMDKSKRSHIIKLLRSLSIFVLIFSLTQPVDATPLDDAHAALEANEFDKTIQLLEKEPHNSANTLYNLATCYYKVGQPGMAALYYHRALLEQPQHPESIQNLKFLSKSLQHPVEKDQKKSLQWIARIPQETYRNVMAVCLWALGLTLFYCILLKPRKLIPFCIAAFLFFAISTLSFTATQLYPKSQYFGPLNEMAVIIEEGHSLKTEPLSITVSEKKDSIVSVPTASLCRVLSNRADWCYVELNSQTRGWLPATALTMIQEPDQAPFAPDLP